MKNRQIEKKITRINKIEKKSNKYKKWQKNHKMQIFLNSNQIIQRLEKQTNRRTIKSKNEKNINFFGNLM